MATSRVRHSQSCAFNHFIFVSFDIESLQRDESLAIFPALFIIIIRIIIQFIRDSRLESGRQHHGRQSQSEHAHLHFGQLRRKDDRSRPVFQAQLSVRQLRLLRHLHRMLIHRSSLFPSLNYSVFFSNCLLSCFFCPFRVNTFFDLHRTGVRFRFIFIIFMVNR